MREIKADLHVHTCLSPCAEPEMVPTAIIDQAMRTGLDIIGIWVRLFDFRSRTKRWVRRLSR